LGAANDWLLGQTLRKMKGVVQPDWEPGLTTGTLAQQLCALATFKKPKALTPELSLVL
jgi:hypothetical protein